MLGEEKSDDMAALPQQWKSSAFSKVRTRFCFSLHYNSDNNYFFVNGKEIFKFKANCKNADFPTQFCRGSISNQFSAFNSREVSLKRIFSVDYNVIDKSDILNIHKYLILYIMLGFFFKLFLGLLNFRESLTNMDNASSLAICISLNN